MNINLLLLILKSLNSLERLIFSPEWRIYRKINEVQTENIEVKVYVIQQDSTGAFISYWIP